jgi:hypothetical protein
MVFWQDQIALSVRVQSIRLEQQSKRKQTMILPTIACARAVRDGGIDAMAALDCSLRAALPGLSEEQARALKRAFGNVMGEVVERLINPAVDAFPELETNEAAWCAIAKEQATLRSARRLD